MTSKSGPSGAVGPVAPDGRTSRRCGAGENHVVSALGVVVLLAAVAVRTSCWTARLPGRATTGQRIDDRPELTRRSRPHRGVWPAPATQCLPAAYRAATVFDWAERLLVPIALIAFTWNR